MSHLSKGSMEKLQELSSEITIKFNFKFEDDMFETEEEVEEVIQYCESGEFDDFTDRCIDEILNLVHTEFFDPPWASPMGQIDRPMGVILDTNIFYN